jgi:hypothetical protein
MRWRTDPSVHIGRAFDQVYRSKPFPRTSTYWVDNRVIATKYIGPMARTRRGRPSEPVAIGGAIIREAAGPPRRDATDEVA